MRYGPNVRYCPTARNFYLIRRILTETLGLPRKAIRPTSTFAKLIPPQERPRIQKRFLQHKLNVLDLSLSRLQLAIAWIVFVGVLLFGLAIALIAGSGAPACGAFVAAIVAGCCMHEILRRCATETNPIFTIKDAVLRVTRLRAYQKAGYDISRDEIARRVFEIVSQNLGVNLDMLTEETNFQEDLGAD